MKARYRYRIYPTDQQRERLAKLFGCVRVVWNDALAYCGKLYRSGEKKPGYPELSSRFLTEAKKTEQRSWLSEVSSVPLQQSLRDLETAYQNFFQSCKGERKGKKARPPRFKKRRAAQSARFMTNGFRLESDKVYLAKLGKIDIVWSRALPSVPSSVTVIKDAAGRYFLSFVVEIQPEPLALNGNSIGIDLGITTFATRLSWVLWINCTLGYSFFVKNLAIKRRNHKDTKDTKRRRN
jgi:putative transposase